MKVPGTSATGGNGMIMLCLCLSVAVNIALAVRVRQGHPPLRSTGFQAGDPVPPIAGVSHTGQRLDLTFGTHGPSTLFYWFSPTCSWCDLNFANFEALAAQANETYRFIPVSTAPPGELAAYADKHHIDFPLYSISPESAARYRFSGTPTTLLVSADGLTVNRWAGAFAPTLIVSLEASLGVRLPGLTASMTEKHNK